MHLTVSSRLSHRLLVTVHECPGMVDWSLNIKLLKFLWIPAGTVSSNCKVFSSYGVGVSHGWEREKERERDCVCKEIYIIKILYIKLLFLLLITLLEHGQCTPFLTRAVLCTDKHYGACVLYCCSPIKVAFVWTGYLVSDCKQSSLYQTFFLSFFKFCCCCWLGRSEKRPIGPWSTQSNPGPWIYSPAR